MSKTIKEWLQTLPEPHREAAITNATLDGSIGYWVTEPTLADALAAAFVWHITPQGQDYWNDVFRRAERGELQQQPD